MADSSLEVVSDLVDYFKCTYYQDQGQGFAKTRKKNKIRRLFTICENELEKKIEIANALDSYTDF